MQLDSDGVSDKRRFRVSAVFTNRLEDMRLQDLAEMDVKLLVQEARLMTQRRLCSLKWHQIEIETLMLAGSKVCHVVGDRRRPEWSKVKA